MANTSRDLAWEAGSLVGVPFWVMWGVQGMETDYGRDIKTSSAKAEGLYQFTAAHKTGVSTTYPMSNSHDARVLAVQSLAAAEYLHYLRLTLGSWEAALRSYSGRGYGEREVAAKATFNGPGIHLVPLGVKVGKGDFGPAPGHAGGLVQGSTPSLGQIAGVSSRRHDYSPKVRHAGRRASEHGSSIQQISRELDTIGRRYRR